MKQTKQEIIKEINSKISFYCLPFWVDNKGNIYKKRQKKKGDKK